MNALLSKLLVISVVSIALANLRGAVLPALP
jgi:hypothetical protein